MYTYNELILIICIVMWRRYINVDEETRLNDVGQRINNIPIVPCMHKDIVAF